MPSEDEAAIGEAAVRQYWERNAATWTRLSRAGYDVCRDYQTSPAFFELLPDVNGLTGLDVGCGEGHNTRRLAARGARVFALDVARDFVRAARQEGSGGIHYLIASALHLPLPGRSFDFVTAFMSLMDVAAPEVVLPEVVRVLKPGGFLQFSILHPCFSPMHRAAHRQKRGRPGGRSGGWPLLRASGRRGRAMDLQRRSTRGNRRPRTLRDSAVSPHSCRLAERHRHRRAPRRALRRTVGRSNGRRPRPRLGGHARRAELLVDALPPGNAGGRGLEPKFRGLYLVCILAI
jgi:SAM-dependent methyltransferase